MKAMFLPALLSLPLATILPAQTCREVVRDASGWVVQTIERQKQGGGGEQYVTRDASGRITGTATTQASGDSTTQTQYRDASGRSAGSATTHGNASGSSHTTYQDASGRMAGSADTSKVAESGSRTQFRDASGRSARSETTSGNGTMSSTHRDATDHLTGNTTGTGKCQHTAAVPAPPPGLNEGSDRPQS